MAKNDFDIDFDFEKEYGLDPKAVLDSDYTDDDLDLDKLISGLGIDMPEEEAPQVDFDDYDLDAEEEELPEEEEPEEDSFDFDLDGDDAVTEEPASEEEEPEEEEVVDDGLFSEEDFDEEEFEDEDIELMDFSRRTSFFGTPEPAEEEPSLEEEEEASDFAEPAAPGEEPESEEEDISDDDGDDEDDYEDDDYEDDEDDYEDEQKAKREKKPRKPIKLPPIKLTVPPVLVKLWKLYFPSKEDLEPKQDPNNPRRRKKSKQQIFKEVYLPPIIAGISLLVVLVLLVGSLGNFISRKRDENEKAKLESIAAENEAAQVLSESEKILAQAEKMAAGYDYKGAADLIESFNGGNLSDFPELTQKRADYLNMQNTMVEHKDPSTIPNLSFHVLIHDLTRALADSTYGGQYNKNFVSTDEFAKILQQLYANGYVLVDFDSFTARNAGVDGSESFYTTSIFLPEGKKPIMITETMVNYFGYMIDSDDDEVADSGGAGFASKLVVHNGEIEAEYVDANGQIQIGDYDLVPILENFIKAHPDFSYRGARATLAVCGMEGIFGYRTNTSYVSQKGEDFYNKEVADAKVLVQALRDKGYTLACYSYDNVSYTGKSATQIEADINNWRNQIVPVIGDVDVIVYARTSDISDYSGPIFKVLYDAGFRYFLRHHDTTPNTEINTTYVRQSRLMVTGTAMFWYGDRYSSMFDTNLVLNSLRGDVPKG